jgi:hypothetical protein
MVHTNGSYHSRDCDWALPREGVVVELMMCVCAEGEGEGEVGCRVMCPRYRVQGVVEVGEIKQQTLMVMLVGVGWERATVGNKGIEREWVVK